MISEEFKRFHMEHSKEIDAPVIPEGADQRRAEIERQTAEFLARGGEIQECATAFDRKVIFKFML